VLVGLPRDTGVAAQGEQLHQDRGAREPLTHSFADAGGVPGNVIELQGL
jgi:hypothetical protein